MPSNFLGREDELSRLQSLFTEVATRDPKGRSLGGPRMAVILAHTGVGKTRLAQELYRWLASHPIWDEGDFWPDDLGSDRDSLRVNPDVPPSAAAPKFAWWGLRASSVDRNASNVAAIVEYASPLRHLAACMLGRQNLGRTALSVGIDLVKDALLPTGLTGAWKLGKKALDLRRERQRSSGDSEHAARESLADELLELLQRLVVERKLPLVVLCDDMQWADAETLHFLRQLWARARDQRWPLLVLATHWETEWNQHLRLSADERAATFAGFDGQPGVELVALRLSPSKDLAAWVRQQLPGLTPKQVDLLVDKAGCNFLQLVQNVQPLKKQAKVYFEGGSADGQLNAKGERYIGSFETDPQKRARQRWEEMSEAVQLVLGWGSHLGMRFLREVVIDMAARSGVELATTPSDALAEATGPLAILAEASENLREFRQGVFHQVAQSSLAVHGYDTAKLDAALKDVLVDWLEQSFDGDAELVQPEEGEHATDGPTPFAARRAIGLLPEEELRDLLAWALRLLPRPAAPDWSDREHVAAVRAAALALLLESDAGQYVRASAIAAERFAEWTEDLAPTSVLGCHVQDRLAECLYWVDENQAAIAWLLWQAQWIETDIGEEHRAYWRYDIAHRLADVLAEIGNWRAAADMARVALDYARTQLAEAHEDSRDATRADLAWRLDDVGGYEQMAGRLDAALVLYREAWDLRRQLPRTQGARRDLSSSLDNVAAIERARGDLDAALAKYAESLVIRRELAAELGTPESRTDLSFSLEMVAGVEEARGDLDAALTLHSESMLLRRELADESGLPFHRRNLSVSLEKVAGIEEARGDLDAALAKYAESLAITRELAAELGTPQSRRDVSVSLSKVAGIEEARGDLDAALAKYAESLAIRRELAVELGTPESQRDLAWMLSRITDLATARGDHTAALAYAEECLQKSTALWDALDSPLDGDSADWLRAARSVRDCAQAAGQLGRALEVARELVDESLSDALTSARMRTRIIDVLPSLTARDREIVKLLSGIGDGYVYSPKEVGRIFRMSEGQVVAVRVAAMESIGFVRSEGADSLEPRQIERLLRELTPCAELSHYGSAGDAPSLLEEACKLASALEAACDDPSVDGDEQQLDATSLTCCADAWELAAEVAASDGRHKEADAHAQRAAALRMRIAELESDDSDDPN